MSKASAIEVTSRIKDTIFQERMIIRKQTVNCNKIVTI